MGINALSGTNSPGPVSSDNPSKDGKKFDAPQSRPERSDMGQSQGHLSSSGKTNPDLKPPEPEATNNSSQKQTRSKVKKNPFVLITNEKVSSIYTELTTPSKNSDNPIKVILKVSKFKPDELPRLKESSKDKEIDLTFEGGTLKAMNVATNQAVTSSGVLASSTFGPCTPAIVVNNDRTCTLVHYWGTKALDQNNSPYDPPEGSEVYILKRHGHKLNSAAADAISTNLKDGGKNVKVIDIPPHKLLSGTISVIFNPQCKSLLVYPV